MSTGNGVYVLGVALARPARRRDDVRLEELVYHTARAALDDAGVSRRQLDNITLGASDELDGRPISSMLLAAPAGGYLTDEIRVTDSAATALCLATARHLAGEFALGLVAGWCKPSKVDAATVSNASVEPFFTRDLGMDSALADGLFAQAVTNEFGIGEDELTDRVLAGCHRAGSNPRGLRREVPTAAEVAASGYESTPVRTAHRAPASDGAACLVVASGRWLRANPGHRPLARIAGVGWASDSYRLDRQRLAGLGSFRTAWTAAFRMADRATGGGGPAPDAVELESPTVFHEAAYTRVTGLERAVVSPSGGTWAQNPLVAAGLVNAVEAVLQVAGRAGPVQVPDARRVVAHSCHGLAQQGNVVAVIDAPGGEADEHAR